MMKNKLLIIGIFLATISCSKIDDPTLTPLQQLPEATKIGANTAGCLVNGEAIYPKGTGNTFVLFYVNQKDFSLGFIKKEGNINKIIHISSTLEGLKEGNVYKLFQYDTESYGEYSIGSAPPPREHYYQTTSNLIGELTITHHNYNKAIISGKFWFNAIDSKGNLVEVREGRFDGEY